MEEYERKVQEEFERQNKEEAKQQTKQKLEEENRRKRVIEKLQCIQAREKAGNLKVCFITQCVKLKKKDSYLKYLQFFSVIFLSQNICVRFS